MNTMGLRDEERLVDSMHTAVDLMNDGMHPNDAIEKVARDGEYGVELIARIVEGVNKSLSVATLKHASEEDRPKSFPLADLDLVVRRIFEEDTQTKTAAQCTLPGKDFSGLGFVANRNEKTASGAEDAPALSEAELRGVRSKLERLDAFFGKAEEILDQKLASARENVMHRLEDTIERLRPLSKPQLHKVAQNVVNYYPHTAEPLFGLLREAGRIDLPALNKTAGRSIFPQEQPYRAISDLHGAAHEFEQLKVELSRMKEAAGAGGAVVAHTLGGAASSALGLRRMQERAAKSEEPAHMDIDPEIVNVLKEMEARRNLMQLTLYDPDMKQYPFSSIIKAYNDSVGTVTDAYRHPNVLKNLMLQRLEGGDVRDVSEMKQEIELGKNLADQILKDDVMEMTAPKK